MTVTAAKVRVLLVEGDPDDYVIARELLEEGEEWTTAIEWAQTYEDALLRLRETHFDVVLVDDQLGGRSGVDLLAEPAVVASGTPVILLSSGGREIDRQAAAAGADDCLGKGELTARALERSIRYAIESRRRHRLERRFQALIESSQDIFAVLDPDGRAKYVSPAIEAMLGFSPEEKLENVLDVVHPDDRERVAQAFHEILRDESIKPRLRHRVAHRDGSWRTLETVAQNLLGDPHVRGIVMTCRDVTSFAQAEEALQQREAELRERVKELRCLYEVSDILLDSGPDWDGTLRAVVELLPPGFLRPDLVGACIRLEGRAYATAGFRATPWSLAVPIHVAGEVAGEVEVCFFDEPPRELLEPFLEEERDLLTAVAGRLGERVERRRAEQAVARSEGRFRAMTERAGLVIGVVDFDGTIRYASEAVFSLAGLRPDAVVGRDVFEFIVAPEQAERAREHLAWAIREPDSIQAGHATIVGADGVARHVEYTLRSLIDYPAVGGVVVTAADITDRVERERRLNFQGELLDRVGQTVFAIDGANCVTYWNRAAEATLGFTWHEVRGRPILHKIFEPSDVAQGLAIRRAVAENRSWEGELSLRTKDGREVILHGGVVASGQDGTRICAGVDVTELRRTQRELTAHRELLANVVASAPVILYALDAEGRFTLSEGSGLSALELAPGELVGTSVFDLPGLDPAVAKDVRRALAGESFQTVRRFADRSFETWWSPLAQAPGAIGVSVDVTELRRAEEEKERAAEQIRFQAHLLDAVGQAVIATDLDGRVIYWNRAAEAIHGYTAEEAHGREVRSLIASTVTRARGDELLARLLRGESWSGEFTLRRKDGSELTALVSNAPIRDAGGDIVGIVGVSSDLSEHKALEARLHQAQKMEAIGRLAGGIAHDFNNLLTVIQGHVAMAHAAADDRPGVIADLEDVQRAADRAADLTRQLLAFGRKQLLRERVIDLRDELSGMRSLLRRLIPESVELDTVEIDRPALVRADPSQIQQVVLNLAVNASDAMKCRGRITIAIDRVSLSPEDAGALPWTATPGDYVELTVEDTGTGMPPEVLAHVFEPFFTTKAEGEGTGLGLATVYGIVKQSKGHVFVESALGEGTTFRVLLPEVVDERPTQAPPASERPRPAAPRRETILVVEDDPLVRRVTTRTLARAGHQVIEAANGKLALELFAGRPGAIDLVLSDVVMPEMGGPELVRRIRELHPGVRVVLTSGYAKGELGSDIEALKVDFVAKPFTTDELVQAVRRALDA